MAKTVDIYVQKLSAIVDVLTTTRSGTVPWLNGRKKRAQEALRLAHDELDAKVRERTAELKRANEQLQSEITEREAAREDLKCGLAIRTQWESGFMVPVALRRRSAHRTERESRHPPRQDPKPYGPPPRAR